ncbi:Rv3654c family TadE-like protein [Actinomyces polynesiensis]|uniref:Rv3654c family TadE-like protein n=1 Tax=Actinomyces polynesiensis TaxID=1325934 RepID=UPI000A8439C1|nr:Rv3654c family TadE-like protein [Actinomyces polynesiensis]
MSGRDRGSGTVAAVGIVLVALLLGVVLAASGSVHAHLVRARAVADLAALAGGDSSAVAAWTGVGAAPCERAGAVADVNGLELVSCSVSGRDTRVVVRDVVVVLGVPVAVGARARAGPQE